MNTVIKGYNLRLGKQAIVQITSDFSIFLQAQIHELTKELNLDLSNIALSLVNKEYDIQIYDLLVYQQDRRIINKVARLYLTDTSKISKGSKRDKNNTIYRIQAIRLYKNDVCKGKHFESVKASQIKDITEYTINLVQGIQGFKMKADTKQVDQVDQSGSITKTQVIVRLTEDVNNVEVPINYRPVVIEYIFDETDWGMQNEYNLSLIRFPQDIYELNATDGGQGS